MNENKPEKKFKAGAISATIWQNEGTRKDGSIAQYRTIKCERSYKDKAGEWKSTSSLRINDLPKATLLLNKAYDYLLSTNSSDDIVVSTEVVA